MHYFGQINRSDLFLLTFQNPEAIPAEFQVLSMQYPNQLAGECFEPECERYHISSQDYHGLHEIHCKNDVISTDYKLSQTYPSFLWITKFGLAAA